ncbi:hypothetical protein DTO027I6_10018 [Penicillium roqueforti]|nr:hypothetical protein CBS147337_9935 [Penicillium roqueforti]KAI3184229.1 hypothetical protein DTO027I6_10018 [Penicillium roqueforti]
MNLDFRPTASAQHLADIIPHGLAILNHKCELVSANCSFRTLIPYPNAKFPDSWLQSIHPDDFNRVNASFKENRPSKAALRIEYRARDHDTWCVLTLNSVHANMHVFGLHALGGFIVTVADITPEKRAEFSQRKLANDAQEHKKLQERFIDMISHEIRNPLSAILHCTEDIIAAVREKEDYKPLSRVTEVAETICLCISHQKKILDDVLTFSKIDASMLLLSPRRVQPKIHFADPISLFPTQLQRNDIRFDYQADFSYADCGIEWVMADLDRMGQVLINLLSNAIKFTARSKDSRKIRVSIGASLDRPSSYPPNVVFFRSGESALGLDKTALPEWGDGEFAYVMLAVKDTGIGIDGDAQMRLFERFNQATPRTEGTYGGSGLGLNISRRLCHLHGGEIGCAYTGGGNVGKDDISEVDKLSHGIQSLGRELSDIKGSTQGVRIPKDPPLSQIDELRQGGPVDERTRRTREIERRTVIRDNERAQSQNEGITSRRILVVEDNIINRSILSRKLCSLGFEIIEANNGQEALNAYQNSSLDCILMDQEMPVINGNAATRRIRELEKESDTHIPILGMTANVRAAQISEMLEAGMDDIIKKPFRGEEIVATISQFLPMGLDMTDK